jgi:hypothetical protein
MSAYLCIEASVYFQNNGVVSSTGELEDIAFVSNGVYEDLQT